MIGLFRTNGQNGQLLSWLGTPDIRPIAPDLRIYDVTSQTVAVNRISLGPHTPLIQAPVTWFGCSFPDVERTGILVSFHTVLPSGHPISHYSKFGELDAGGSFYGSTYTTLYSEEPQDHFPVGIIKLKSGALVAAFYSLTLDGNMVRYSFHYRTRPQDGSVWKSPVSFSLPYVASSDTTQTNSLIEHYNQTIYFFRCLNLDTAIGMIQLEENLTLGTISVLSSNSSFISTGHTLPPFVGSPQLRTSYDPNRNGIVLAYPTSVEATTFNRARVAFCFVPSSGSNTFLKMTGKYINNAASFEIGTNADISNVWFAGECIDDTGNPTTVQVGVYNGSAWSFTAVASMQLPIYPIRDDFSSTFGSGMVSGFAAIVAGNLIAKSFTEYQAALDPGKAFWLSPMPCGNNTAFARASVLDASGNIYVGGFFSGSMTFGSTVISNSYYTSGYLAKYDSAGNCLWAIKLPSAFNGFHINLSEMAVDSSGNVFVVGAMDIGTMNLGTGDLVNSGPKVNQVWCAKYSPSSTCLWSKTFVNAGPGPIAVDSNNDVILCAIVYNNAVFGSFTLTTSGANNQKMGLIKLAGATGIPIWALPYGTTYDDWNYSQVIKKIAIRTDNSFVVAGDFQIGVDLGGGERTAPAGNTGLETFIGGYAADGTYQWDKIFTGPALDFLRALAIAPDSGNILVGGATKDQINFGSGLEGAPGGYVVALNPNTRTKLWSKFVYGGINGTLYDIKFNAANRMVICGSANQNQGIRIYTDSFLQIISAGSPNVGYVATYNVTGNAPLVYLWHAVFPWNSYSAAGGSSESFSSQFVDTYNVVNFGTYHGSVDFLPFNTNDAVSVFPSAYLVKLKGI